jgi:hypothetical protein
MSFLRFTRGSSWHYLALQTKIRDPQKRGEYRKRLILMISF